MNPTFGLIIGLVVIYLLITGKLQRVVGAIFA